SAGMVEEVSARLETTVDSLSGAWSQALAAQREANEKLAANNQHALSCAASVLEQHAVTLVSDLSQSQQALQAELIGQDRQRLDTWAASLNETAEALRLAWLEAGEQARSGHREVCAALAQTADEIATQARAHADGTITEMAKLAQLAGEAPVAAASLVAEVRQAFSDSMARDNDMLDERNRLLETSASLLDAMRHASSEQREAIDALLVKSTDVLERVGSRFTEQARAES